MAVWAHRALPTKNTLTAADSAVVEEAFGAKLNGLTGEVAPATISVADLESETRLEQSVPAPKEPDDSTERSDSAVANPVVSDGSNAAVADCVELAFGKTRRKRDKDHRAFVASKPCLVCGRHPADAHHLRFAQPRALGRKVSDEFTVPVCRVHHRELHRHSDEAAWWGKIKLDPLPIARRLWQHTRLNETAVSLGEGAAPKSAAATNGAERRSTAAIPVPGDEAESMASEHANGRANQ